MSYIASSMSYIASSLTVSVVIPAYRAAWSIGRAIDSLLTQTRLPDEIVVVDDGSPDDLPGALKPYGDRVISVRQPNGGASSARNLGIERARGDLIAFLDADDYWEPTKLERQLDIFRCHPEVGLVASQYFVEVPGRARFERQADRDRFLSRPLVLTGRKAFELATIILTSTILVRRSVIGDHRFITGLEPAEDRDLWVRLVTSGPVYLLPDHLVTRVVVPGSLSNSHPDRDYANMLRVVHRHQGLLGRRGLRHWEARLFSKWAAVHLGDGRPRAALAPAWAHLLRRPLSLAGWWVLFKSATLSTLSIIQRITIGLRTKLGVKPRLETRDRVQSVRKPL